MENEKNITKRKKGIVTQNQILITASRLFACKGYDSVSIREIAKEVGIKESSIYNHFNSKKDILEALFKEFAVRAPDSRPTQEQLEQMSKIMSLREIMKNILFCVGRNIDEVLENTAIIIQCERFKNALGAEAYYKYLVYEPELYYQDFIEMMLREKRLANQNARKIIKPYCYLAQALSQEFFMAKNGFGCVEEVVRQMLETIDFFCDLIMNNNTIKEG
jgi:AcrR family transcriptional regulator